MAYVFLKIISLNKSQCSEFGLCSRVDDRFLVAHELSNALKLNSSLGGLYQQSLPTLHSFIYIHPFNTCARHCARLCVPDDTVYAVSFTTLTIWLISVFFFPVGWTLSEFYLLKSTGCQPDELLPLKLISQLHEIKDTHSSVNRLANFLFSILLSTWHSEWILVAYIRLRVSDHFLRISSYI